MDAITAKDISDKATIRNKTKIKHDDIVDTLLDSIYKHINDRALLGFYDYTARFSYQLNRYEVNRIIDILRDRGYRVDHYMHYVIFITWLDY